MKSDILEDMVEEEGVEYYKTDKDWENGLLYGVIIALMAGYFFSWPGAILGFVLGFCIGYKETPRG